jgi:2'-5' RNA ligase
MALARETAAALEALGLPVEDKPYQPHLTLARIKGGADLAALRQAIAQLPSTGFGEFVAARHLLYRSRPGPSGSVYSVEADFTLPAVVAGSAS